MLKCFGALFGRTESVLLVAILVTTTVFSLSSPYFFTLANFVNLVEAYSVTTIFAAGSSLTSAVQPRRRSRLQRLSELLLDASMRS